MNLLEQRPDERAQPGLSLAGTIAPPRLWIGLDGGDDTDDLSTMRGLTAGILLSLPVWAGVGYVAWKALH